MTSEALTLAPDELRYLRWLMGGSDAPAAPDLSLAALRERGVIQGGTSEQVAIDQEAVALVGTSVFAESLLVVDVRSADQPRRVDTFSRLDDLVVQHVVGADHHTFVAAETQGDAVQRVLELLPSLPPDGPDAPEAAAQSLNYETLEAARLAALDDEPPAVARLLRRAAVPNDFAERLARDIVSPAGRAQLVALVRTTNSPVASLDLLFGRYGGWSFWQPDTAIDVIEVEALSEPGVRQRVETLLAIDARAEA